MYLRHLYKHILFFFQRYVNSKAVVSEVMEQTKLKQEKHARAKRTVEEILSSLTLSTGRTGSGSGGMSGGRRHSTSGSTELLASVARLRKEKEAAKLVSLTFYTCGVCLFLSLV
jgi:hypothetical protein